MTRFNDNRRLHLFVVDVASGRVDQLTDGISLRALDRLVAERATRLLFLTNRDADDDEFFNYDMFTVTSWRTGRFAGSPRPRATSTTRAGRRTGR